MRNAYDHFVGARALPIRSYSPDRRRGPGTREIAAIAILTALAVALAWFLVAADIRSDLSDLRPYRNTTDAPSTLIGWPELRDPRQPSEFEQDPRHLATSVRMLGYIMEGVPAASKGEEIKTFILTPGVGQFLRHASRNPDDRVEVRLRQPVRFGDHELVWVFGRIEREGHASRGTSADSWVMMDGEVFPAEQREITRWFTP